MPQAKDTCNYCIFFGINPYKLENTRVEWCFRWNITLLNSDTDKCEKFICKPEGDAGHSRYRNPPLDGLKEREKDRKKEKITYLIISGLIGIIGVIIGYLLK